MAWVTRRSCVLFSAASLLAATGLQNLARGEHELSELPVCESYDLYSTDLNSTDLCVSGSSECSDDGCGWDLYGWLDAGYVYNTANPQSEFNGPYNSQDQDVGMFNQVYLVTEKTLHNDSGIGLGGRFDLLYGWDFLLGQSTGLELNPNGTNRWNSSQYYGLALPQIYGEMGNKDISLKFGHWYSIVGYEGLPAAAAPNFFYTKSYSYQFAGPFTHWGGIAAWQANDNWQWQGGLHNGWNQLDGPSDHMGFIGGAKYTSDLRDWWSSFAITAGTEPNNPAALPITDEYTDRVRYSWIWDAHISSRTEYVFHHWLGVQQEGAVGGGDALWYGIDQYLYYTLTSTQKLGTRFEWFRDEDGTRVGLNRPSNPNKPPLPGNFFSWTLGDNWTPSTYSNLLVRPELRWDFYDGPAKPYDDGAKMYQLLLGFDVIWLF